jgi:exosortase
MTTDLTRPAGTDQPIQRSVRVALLLKTAVVVGLSAFLFWDVLIGMARDWWTTPALSQGMLIPPLALYIAWLGRDRTLQVDARPDYRGLALTLLACAMFVLGKLASEFFLLRFSFVALLAGFAWTFWGPQRLRTLAFPFLLLATMVPLPVMLYNTLAAPLQLFASDMATRIAQSLSISVYRDGNVIQLAHLSLGVAEACSGLTSLSALAVGGLIVGYLVCSSMLSRSLLCLASIPIAIGVNVLRVAATAILADYDESFAMGFYHMFSGWVVFVGGLGLLYVTAMVLNRRLDGSLQR